MDAYCKEELHVKVNRVGTPSFYLKTETQLDFEMVYIFFIK
jgi:hypothetical protein